MTTLFWLPLVCVVLHITEEFIWPGRFAEWYRSYRPELAPGITPRVLLIANALLLLLTVVTGEMGVQASRGPSLWMGLMTALAANGVWHIWGTWRTRRYSPGVVTGSLLYIPLCLFGFSRLLADGQASLSIAATSFALGIGYELYSRLFLLWRTASAKRAFQGH